MSHPHVNFVNVRAPNVPYFTPAQAHAAGTALNPPPDGRPIPKPFQPITIRGLEFQNRIWLAPLAQYSADDGRMTPWHTAHLGGIITRGPGLSFIEATAITPAGRTSQYDLGLWSDGQVEPLRQLVDFAHSQSQKIGIQLFHGGRRSNTITPWLSRGQSTPRELGGWPDKVVAPSAITYDKNHVQPRELSKEDMEELLVAYANAATRAVTAGVDVIEILGGHGYLINNFLSPQSNVRTDKYGGSFENRVRFPLEIVDVIRASIPADMPLFFRISATDWLEHLDKPSWTIEDTKRFTPLLASHGVDLLDVSSSGTSPLQNPSGLSGDPIAQSKLAHIVREHIQGSLQTPSPITVAGTGKPLLISAVRGISTGALANQILEEGRADVVFVGRYFQQNPGLVWQMARELGVAIHLAHQIQWAFK